jgi:hypothetical protein
MANLLEILGRNVGEPDVVKRLMEFPGLRAERSGDTADERAHSVKYLRSHRDGLLLKLSSEGNVLAIFMMSDGKEGSSEFTGELPGRINFAAEPEDAIRALGPPTSRRAAAKYGGHELGELLRYDFPAYSLHIQFRAEHDGIDIVTAMTASQVPGRSVAQPPPPRAKP